MSDIIHEIGSDKKVRYDVYVDKGKHHLFQELTEGKDAPFLTMKDVLLTAACVGFNNESRIKLNTGEKIFSWKTFTPQIDHPFLHALALVAEGKDDVLIDQDKILTVVEEYANGGINDLYDTISKPGSKISNLVNIILKKEEIEDTITSRGIEQPN